MRREGRGQRAEFTAPYPLCSSPGWDTTATPTPGLRLPPQPSPLPPSLSPLPSCPVGTCPINLWGCGGMHGGAGSVRPQVPRRHRLEVMMAYFMACVQKSDTVTAGDRELPRASCRCQGHSPRAPFGRRKAPGTSGTAPKTNPETQPLRANWRQSE